MGEFFLGIIEITLGMTILILLMFPVLKSIGGKFTAKCRYILWALVMIRLAVPLGFGILPALIEVPVETLREPPVHETIQLPVGDYTPVVPQQTATQLEESVQIPTPPAEIPVPAEPEPDTLTWEDAVVYIPHLYLAGAAVFLLWNLLAYGIYTAKILRFAKPTDAETREIYEAVCRKKELHRPPILLISPDVNSPAAFGLIRRRIVLPDIELTENGLAGTLSHEVTHCKRGDLWIKAVCLFARSFHWFNPLVHLAALKCEMEMELSCDEAVLAGCSDETRAAYGEVMLDIIRRCRQNRGTLTTHFNPKKNAVKARFTNILYGSGKKRGLWLIAVCLVLCLIAGAIVACRTEEDTAETVDEVQQGETLLAAYELYQTEYNDLQVQMKLLDNKYADLMASRAELQTELQSLTASRESLQLQLGSIPEDSEEALQLRMIIQEYDELIKSRQLAITGIDSEITLVETQRQTIQEKLQSLSAAMNDTEAKVQEMNILSESWVDYTPSAAHVNSDTIWQTFLDTVVSQYTDYIVATEFLDLDGNGIDELIIYNWGASANCGIEIFTIENGKVRSFSTGTSVITHHSGEAKALAPPSANAVDFAFWGLPTSYSDKSDVILWFVPCDSRTRNGHVLYSMNGSDVHTSEDYYYFTSDANGNLTVEVLRSFRCEAIDSNPANGWKCYINGEETNVRGFRDTMLFFWQDLAVTHGVQYHDKNTASRYAELEAWMEPPLDASALLEKNLEEIRQMEGEHYRAIEAILSSNSSMLEAAMKLPEGTGQMFTGITLASWAVDRISDDRYFNPIRLTLEITESSSSVFPVGISTWIVDEGMDGVTLTNYENPVVRNPNPTTDAEEAVWTWLRGTGQILLPLNADMTDEKKAEFGRYATEYACRHADGTIESIRSMVKACFGSEEYFNDEILYTGDGVHYGVGGHGAARHSYDWLGTTENKDGSITVKILFYADPSKFIPAKTVEYTLVPTGEDVYGQTVYFFRSCEVVGETGYSAYFKWT